jgi:hypothetical protein
MGDAAAMAPRTRSAIDPQQDEASKMPEWALGGRSLHVVNRPTRPLLQLAIPPASPDQFGHITTRQPLITWLTLFRQRDLDDFAVIAFSGMMADGRAQILQVSPSATSVTSFPSVSATRLTVHLAEHLCAPPRVQSLDALLEFSHGGNGVFVFAINFEAITKLF